MSKTIELQEIRAGGPMTLVEFSDGERVIGREPDAQDGIALSKTSVSRNHGRFFLSTGYLFYEDLTSTNGSWINGNKIPGGQTALVRDGDIVQLADAAVRVREKGVPNVTETIGQMPSIAVRNLLVVSHGRLEKAFPIPDVGRALVVGGPEGNVPLPGNLSEDPALVVEKRGEAVCGFAVSKNVPVYLNGEALTASSVVLSDRDVIRVGELTIFYNDPTTPGTSAPSGSLVQERDNSASSTIPGWDSQESTEERRSSSVTKTHFGSREEEPVLTDETIAMDPADVASEIDSYGHPASRRFAMRNPQNPKTQAFRSMEDKIVLGVGALLMIILVSVVVVLWFFQ